MENNGMSYKTIIWSAVSWLRNNTGNRDGS